MAEYIDREALIKNLQQRIKESNSLRYSLIYEDFIDIVKDAQTADVVDVIMCEDCKYWDEEGRCNGIKNGLILEYTNGYDYCSYGERKDGAEE